VAPDAPGPRKRETGLPGISENRQGVRARCAVKPARTPGPEFFSSRSSSRWCCSRFSIRADLRGPRSRRVDLGIWGGPAGIFSTPSLHSGMSVRCTCRCPAATFVGGPVAPFNLISAHVYRFKFTWRKSGIFPHACGNYFAAAGRACFPGSGRRSTRCAWSRGEPMNLRRKATGSTNSAIVDTTDKKFRRRRGHSRIAARAPARPSSIPKTAVFACRSKNYYPQRRRPATARKTPGLPPPGGDQRRPGRTLRRGQPFAAHLQAGRAQRTRRPVVELTGSEGPVGFVAW